VHQYGQAHNIPVRHPENFKAPDDIKAFEDLNLDVAIVAAYGLLLPQAILKAPQYGCINIHPSLLPRWRGPSPIQYAIWKGDEETGVSVMRLEKKMDAGPVLAQERTNIGHKDFTALNTELWQAGTQRLLEILDDLAETGFLESNVQNEDAATYCKLLSKEDGRINWQLNAQEIDRQIRALNPWPGTWCLDENDRRVKILSAEIGEGTQGLPEGTILDKGHVVCGKNTILRLRQVQPENKKPMDIKAAVNGGYLKAGTKLQ
jgi:methionyl-tRNA formyltransferase